MEGLEKTKVFFKPNDFNLTDFLIEEISKEEIINDDDLKEKKSQITDSKSDSESYNPNLSHRDFIMNESWDKTLNISSRIMHITKDSVSCECVIDRENKVFQTRQFPRELFEHIEPLESQRLVIIKIRSKIGSSRIDIYNGENLVDASLFEIKDNWDSLKDSDLHTPLSF